MFRPRDTTREEFHSANENVLRPHNAWKIFKTQQSPVIFALKKTRSGKYRIIVSTSFSKNSFFKIFFRPHEKPAFSNFPGLKSVYAKLRFRDRLVWTVRQAVDWIKLRFKNFSSLVRTLPSRLAQREATSEGPSCGKFASVFFPLHPQWLYLIVWSHIVISWLV